LCDSNEHDVLNIVDRPHRDIKNFLLAVGEREREGDKERDRDRNHTCKEINPLSSALPQL